VTVVNTCRSDVLQEGKMEREKDGEREGKGRKGKAEK